ncbi:MAG: hypothetical protein IGS03_15140 [Candidatus Sericytochromatia bacterium]|nr:hypothetical protein [Candidatus Sericytochromatia bacterium]
MIRPHLPGPSGLSPTEPAPAPQMSMHSSAPTPEADTDTAASLNTADQAQTQTPAAHGSAANLLSFESPSPETSTEPPDEAAQMAQLQTRVRELGPEASSDPDVQALLEAVRQQEDQHIKALLQMMQESLDRAREMQEENKRYFYAETLPKMQALEASLQQESQQAEAALNSVHQRQDQTAGALVQALQNQLSQAPPGPDPVAQALRTRLNLIAQRLSLL